MQMLLAAACEGACSFYRIAAGARRIGHAASLPSRLTIKIVCRCDVHTPKACVVRAEAMPSWTSWQAWQGGRRLVLLVRGWTCLASGASWGCMMRCTASACGGLAGRRH
jgi:hypothetical protein